VEARSRECPGYLQAILIWKLINWFTEPTLLQVATPFS
jgi:hypothetical protein